MTRPPAWAALKLVAAALILTTALAGCADSDHLAIPRPPSSTSSVTLYAQPSASFCHDLFVRSRISSDSRYRWVDSSHQVSSYGGPGKACHYGRASRKGPKDDPATIADFKLHVIVTDPASAADTMRQDDDSYKREATIPGGTLQGARRVPYAGWWTEGVQYSAVQPAVSDHEGTVMVYTGTVISKQGVVVSVDTMLWPISPKDLTQETALIDSQTRSLLDQVPDVLGSPGAKPGASASPTS